MNLTIEALDIPRNFEVDCENFLEAVRRIAQGCPNLNITCQNKTVINVERLVGRLKKIDDIVDPNITKEDKRKRKGILRDNAHISDVESVTKNEASVIIETEPAHQYEAYSAADKIAFAAHEFKTLIDFTINPIDHGEYIQLFVAAKFSSVRRKS